MNLVALTGHLEHAPRIGTKGDVAYASFRLADKTGKRCDCYPVVCFKGAAETAAKLWLGARVNVSGYLRVHRFEGREHVEIVATSIDILSEPGEDAIDPSDSSGW